MKGDGSFVAQSAGRMVCHSVRKGDGRGNRWALREESGARF